MTAQAAETQCGSHALGLRRRDRQKQQIRSMQSGGNQFTHAQVPTVAGVFVLKFGAHVGNAALGFDQIDRLAAHSITPPIAVECRAARPLVPAPCALARARAAGSRPHIAAQQLEQLRLAGAVVAHQGPALPRPQSPGDVTQNPFVAAPHAHCVQQHRQPLGHVSRQRPSRSAARCSRASLIKCASKVRRAQRCRSAATSS